MTLNGKTYLHSGNSDCLEERSTGSNLALPPYLLNIISNCSIILSTFNIYHTMITSSELRTQSDYNDEQVVV